MNPPPDCDRHDDRLRDLERGMATISERIDRREEVSRLRHDEVMTTLREIRTSTASHEERLANVERGAEHTAARQDALEHRADTIEAAGSRTDARLWKIVIGGGGSLGAGIGVVWAIVQAVTGG